jgi:succinate dehydrogenase / fumarate reductase flavoprotein subunit
MSEYETIDHDVLVIGAAGAGLRAALEAAATGVNVRLVCQSLPRPAPPLQQISARR